MIFCNIVVVSQMEPDYFEPENPPSCTITCLVMIIATAAITPVLLIPLLWEDESTYFISILLATVIFCIVLFPVSWWATKRIKKWARISVERRDKIEEEID